MTSPANPDALSGRRALVTGGARGIGAAVVADLARRGADVTYVDISLDQIDAVLAATDALAVQLDVSDPVAVADELARHAPFDILVNNAGRDQHSFFTDTSPEDWNDLLAVNLLSVFACTKAVLPAMQVAGHGRIINVASEAGRVGSRGGAIYSAAKGGVIAFTKSIARENAKFGITSNVIAPGPIRTPLLDKALDAGGPPLLAAMQQATLLRRLGTPQEVAGLVGHLATDSAAYITGEVIGVSGGMGC